MALKIKAAPKTRDALLPPFPGGGTPTWEIAYLFPAQGTWTEDDYFNLDGVWEGVPRVELSNGRLDVVAMPTELHQYILVYLLNALSTFNKAHAPGLVLPSGIRLRLKRGNFREPDLAYIMAENRKRRHSRYWDGADLVMEIVSEDPKDAERNWKDKVREYAKAGISKYWIVDPQKKVICVLRLEGKSYKIHGEFGPGTKATSVLLPGFSVPVDEVLNPEGASEEE
jgi:Uma2 family endonuclease